MIFTRKSSKRIEVCLHYVTRQNVAARAARNDQFVNAFVDVNVDSRNDVFDVRFCKLTEFCTSRFNVKYNSFNDFPAFSVRF